MKHILFTFLLFSISLCSLSQETEWKKAKEKDGITIYTRGSELTRVKEFKVIATVNASLNTIINVLRDPESSCEWVKGCKSSELLELKKDKLKYYMEIKVPFPFQDRDLVQGFNFEKINDDQVRVNLENLPDDIARKKKIIRLEIAEGEWLIKKISNFKTEVTLQYISDPGGFIPSWLTNLFIVDSSYGYIEGLRKMVKREEYQVSSGLGF